MADVATLYQLASDSCSLVFNSGFLGDGDNKYWLTSVQGLDGPAIRAPTDLVPYGDGGRVYEFRLGPRRIVMDGMLLIESNKSQAACMEQRNVLVDSLAFCLDAIISASGNGQLFWTPAGQSPLVLPVIYETGLQITYSDNYAVANFSFGLISPDADPAAA